MELPCDSALLLQGVYPTGVGTPVHRCHLWGAKAAQPRECPSCHELHTHGEGGKFYVTNILPQ